MEIEFLGTGGGRNVIFSKERRVAGFVIRDGIEVLVDPGPSTYCVYDGIPDAIFVSHNHIDHSENLHVMIERMTRATKEKRGRVIAPPSVYISPYHTSLTRVERVTGGEIVNVSGKRMEVIPLKHNTDCVGFVYEDRFTYIADSGYTPSLPSFIRDVVVFNTQIIAEELWKDRCSTGCVLRVLEESPRIPKLVVLTHFGVYALRKDPVRAAKELEERLGLEVLAAYDGMRISI